jgi:PIN domain nuclease of toxin-antitoxin system
VNLLLDTHIVLWWLDDHPALSSAVRNSIAIGANLVFLSAAVVWEIRIKEALGKLDIPSDFSRVLDRQPFEKLAIKVEHAHAVKDLPLYHRDPFDRMLIAQALTEGLTVATHDPLFEKYSVPLLRN